MNKIKLLVFSVWVLGVSCQRPSFAGSRPIGYPELSEVLTTPKNELGNRFGETDGTTQRLPLEAMGDQSLIDRISKLPVDQQPFWFINWQALEEYRKKPQTYPQKPNEFIVPNPFPASGTNNGNFNNNIVNRNANDNINGQNLNTRSPAGDLTTNVNSFNPSFENRNSNIHGTQNSNNVRERDNGNLKPTLQPITKSNQKSEYLRHY